MTRVSFWRQTDALHESLTCSHQYPCAPTDRQRAALQESSPAVTVTDAILHPLSPFFERNSIFLVFGSTNARHVHSYGRGRQEL
jgi:hypothetical protein